MAPNTIGNYRIDERIGRGGMGVVYRGRHLKLPREVAIKSIDATNQRDLRHLRDRFEQEAYIQSQLDHPGIVKVYDYIVAEQTYYIVMEFIAGRSLAELLEREVCPLPLDRALDLFEQMLEAIAHAQEFVYSDRDGSSHKGLVHRDLKPANILITPEDRVKITDFGIVKLVGSERTNTGSNYGSPEYVSPEHAEGAHVDPRSDLYSLGIILYEMLTGRPPFHDEGGKLSQLDVVRSHIHSRPQPPSELNKSVTPELESLILRALEKRPEDRFASAAEFLKAIRRARGREEKETERSNSAVTTARRKVGTQEIVTPTIAHDFRTNYETQPINPGACPKCGAETSAGDVRCRKCGQELGNSPATAKLARGETRERLRVRSFGLWLGVGAAVVALAAILFFLVGRDRRAPESANDAKSSPAEPSATPVPDSALVEVKPLSVDVDSNYEGYDTGPLFDGETDVRRIASMRYNRGNWASAETNGPHFIHVVLPGKARIGAVYIYWGFDRNRFMPSRRVELRLDEKLSSGSSETNPPSQERTISVMEPGNNFDRTAFEFAPFEAGEFKIYQPPQAGPSGRPFVMWVREVKVFAVK